MSFDNENKNTDSKKMEITSNDILQCLMHTATREDIAELRAELKSDISKLNDKLEIKSSKTDMADLRKELKIDMAELKVELKGEMQSLRKDNNKYFRWIVGLMFGSFGGIAIMILKFPMLTH